MMAHFFKPQPALQHLVHSIMVSSTSVPLSEISPVNPFPPLSQHALYFYVHDPISTQFFGEKEFKIKPQSIIIGPQLIRVNIKMGHDNVVVRVGFQPDGLHRLVKFPMHEILDYACDSTAVFGNIINEVHEKLNEAQTPLEMKSIVENFLIKRVHEESSPFISSIKHLIIHNGNIPIHELAWQTGLSTRQFERKCNESLGLSPKMFARITRFSKAYRLRLIYPEMSWTSIVYQCGYFDQMHFIKDFKQFTGVTPSAIEHELSMTPLRLQADFSL